MNKNAVKKGISVTRWLREIAPTVCYAVGLLPIIKLAGNLWLGGAAYVRLFPDEVFDSIMFFLVCSAIGYIISWLKDMAALHEAKSDFLSKDNNTASELMSFTKDNDASTKK